MAFQQYQQLIEQFNAEKGGPPGYGTADDYKPEDIYEPEMALDDDGSKFDSVSVNLSFTSNKEMSLLILNKACCFGQKRIPVIARLAFQKFSMSNFDNFIIYQICRYFLGKLF